MNHKEIERWYRLRNLKRLSQFLVLFAIVLLAAGYVASRLIVERPMFPKFPLTGGTGITIENFNYSSPGAHPWELAASRAVVSDSLNRVELTGPKVLYHGASGADIHLSAGAGTLDKKDNNVSMKDDVRIQFRGFLFKTDDIQYSHSAREAETASPVSLEGPDLHLTGKGLKVSVEKEEIVVEDDVQARLYNVKWVESGGKLPM
ncbi:MAG: LPS export ABC transporter periplasmic protein LptC [Desulfomonile tiedjei]|nr:LPS export ABC transporter periplasmic protein LptC [Desulfomonile tiedjei]